MILLLAILGLTLYGTIGFLIPLFTRSVYILRYSIFLQFFGG
jgi:preprotein translocase subunit Sss1